jgi:hypothetical protein
MKPAIQRAAHLLLAILIFGARLATAAGPTVSITAPANNATYVAPASVTISATASKAGGSVTRVQFYRGTTLLSTVTASPYTYTWTGVATGAYTLTAKATDNTNTTTTSAAVTVKVNPNVAPAVSVTAPAANATFVAPAAITIGANASDSDGTISRVDFYNGTTLLGTDTTSPYSFAWAGVGAGTYSLTAKATDNKGAVTTSAAVSVKVNANAAPTVSITSPAINASFTAPASINISASAADSDGTISKVDFYNGATLLGTDTTSPYSFAWSNVAAGSYSLTAKATDNNGAVSTSTAVSITVGSANQAPSVSLIAPANGATFSAPASITITATATDSDGTISKVDFYRGTNLLGTATSAPYSYTWTNVAVGTYSITARVTDNKGAVTTSSAASVTVAANLSPTIDFNLPAATDPPPYAPADIVLGVNASDADGTIAKVEFFRGTTRLGESTSAPFRYTWTGVAAGTYSLTAKATDNQGAATTSAAKSIAVEANPSPVNINFRAQGAAFVDKTVFAASIPFSIGANFNGATRGELLANGILICAKDLAALEILLDCPAATMAPGVYVISGRAIGSNGILNTKTAGTIYVETTPAVMLSLAKPSATEGVWFKSVSVEGAFTVPSGGTIRAYRPQDCLLAAEVEIPLTLAGSRFTGAYDATAPCASAYLRVRAQASDGRNVEVKVVPVERTPRIAIVSPASGKTHYSSSIDVDVQADVPPGSSVLVGGITPTTLPNGLMRATLSLTPGANQIQATASNGGAVIAQSAEITIKYIVAVDRELSVETPTDGQKIVFATLVDLEKSLISVSGSVTGIEATTVLVRDAMGSMHIADIQSGRFSIGIPVVEGENSIEVSAYGPGGATARGVVTFQVLTATNNGVVLTAPSTCTTIPSGPASMTFSAAARTAKPLSRIDFMANGSVVASSSAAPYTASWSGIANGTYELRAVAYVSEIDSPTSPPVQGAQSPPVMLTVGTPNAAPTCVLKSPANGSTHYVGQPIPLEVSASDTDGTIAKVEFFLGSLLAGTKTTPPYRVQLIDVVAGFRTIGARVTDSGGRQTSCAPVTIDVKPDPPLAVSLLEPPPTMVILESGGVIIEPGVSPNVVKIQLWRGTELIGEQTAAPFSFTYINLDAGIYTLFARAFNAAGASVDSNSITFRVSKPPTVSLNAPTSGTVYTAPAAIPISVSASVPDGTIERVDIAVNDSLVATLTSAPYTFELTGVPAGSYTISANAFSNWGASLPANVRPVRNVVVVGGTGGALKIPEVKLTAPLDNSTVGSPVTLSVSAQNVPGTIATIELLDGNNQIVGYNVNAVSSNYTLNYVWGNAAFGSHTITAKVINSAGVTYTSPPVTVQISAAPTVDLSATSSFYLAPADVDLVIGTAVLTAGATLSRVEIYSSLVTGGSIGASTLVATLSVPPYRHRLSGLGVGTYRITARAIDSLGNSSESAPLEIRVGTAYGIVLPATLNGSTVDGTTLAFTATINAPSNSSVSVNGVNVVVGRDGRISVNDLWLNAGVNTITITVRLPSGAVLTQTFTVTRASTVASFEMSVSPTQGVAPMLSLVEVKNPGNTPFAIELLSCDNPTGNVALAENLSASLAGALECRYTKPGVYHPWAAIKNSSGAVIWSSTKFVVVSGPLDSFQVVRNVYLQMVDYLKAGNKTDALRNFFGHAQAKYSEIFTALGADLAVFATQLGTIGAVTIAGDTAEIVLVRDVNNTRQSFTIYLMRGEDGVWRIESM